MQIRRVVTGHADGESVILTDDFAPAVTDPTLPGSVFHEVWTIADAPHFPGAATADAIPTYFPETGGTRFNVIEVPVTGDTSIGGGTGASEPTTAGMFDAFDDERPGMHTTDTVDYGFVLAGTIHLELGDGSVVRLPTGSCVVQQGTTHAWRNHGPDNALVAFVMVGGTRAEPATGAQSRVGKE